MTFGRIAVVFTVGVAMGIPARPAQAAPPSARSVEAEVERLGTDIAMLNEDYNEARLRLSTLQSRLRDLGRRNEEAERRLTTLRQTASRRAASVYQSGVPSFVVALLSSRDAAEASRRLALVARVDEWEAGLATDMTIARQRAESAGADLRAGVARARSVERTIARKRDGLERRLAQQRVLLRQARAVRPPERPARRPVAAPPADVPPADFAPGVSPGARAAVASAYRMLGRPYRYGAEGPDSFDCSGLTRYAWREGGVSLPHSSRAQYASLPHVPREDIQPGDLLFYGNPIHHMGMYIGGGRMIHAPETGSTVEIVSWQRRDFVGAARPG